MDVHFAVSFQSPHLRRSCAPKMARSDHQRQEGGGAALTISCGLPSVLSPVRDSPPRGDRFRPRHAGGMVGAGGAASGPCERRDGPGHAAATGFRWTRPPCRCWPQAPALCTETGCGWRCVSEPLGRHWFKSDGDHGCGGSDPPIVVIHQAEPDPAGRQCPWSGWRTQVRPWRPGPAGGRAHLRARRPRPGGDQFGCASTSPHLPL